MMEKEQSNVRKHFHMVKGKRRDPQESLGHQNPKIPQGSHSEVPLALRGGSHFGSLQIWGKLNLWDGVTCFELETKAKV